MLRPTGHRPTLAEMHRRSILPTFDWTRTYRRADLRKDLVAGIVLTAILVPAGMGYAEASGLPPIVGLYASIVPLLAYAALGPSRILVLGPDSSLVPLIAAAIIPLSGGDQTGGHAGRPPGSDRGRGRHHRRDRSPGIPDRPPVRPGQGRLPERHRADRHRRPAAETVRLQRRCRRPRRRGASVRDRRSRGRDGPSPWPSASPAWSSSWASSAGSRRCPGSSSPSSVRRS